MKVHCKHCLPEEEFDMPVLTDSEKKRYQAMRMHSPIQTVKTLMKEKGLNHGESKYVVNHINSRGLCQKCKAKLNEEEYINCSNCGALNFNWKLN